MKMTEKVREATTEELTAMPKALYHAYQQGRLVVKALKTFVFYARKKDGVFIEKRLKPGKYWTFAYLFWRVDEVIILSKNAAWYWENAEEVENAIIP